MKTDEIVQSFQNDTNHGQGEGTDHVLLISGPEKKSFVFKYFLAFTPCILVLVSIIARYFLDIITRIFSVAVTSAISSPMNSTLSSTEMSLLLPDSMTNIGSSVSYGTNVTVLMIAPVGIFVIFAAIGWSLRIAEMWTGVALTLVLSGIVGLLLVIVTGTGVVQDNFLRYLEWIAFLVQPFSIIATLIVLIWLEKFRKSIHYTITDIGVSYRGGLFKKQEHLIPHSQIGRVVLEQNFLGTRYNFGTVIPISSTRWGEETSFRGIGATGQKDNFGGGIMFGKGREEASRFPLDCLYGIPDPGNAQRILTQFISQQARHEAEQVSYLKKIYDRGNTGIVTGESGVPHKASSAIIEYVQDDENMTDPPGKAKEDEKVTDNLPGAIIRVNDPDPTNITTDSQGNTMREIPLAKQPEKNREHAIPSVESIPDLIKKLAELRDAGIITEHEFETKKAELLKRM
mgnify:CR=1 FL=1